MVIPGAGDQSTGSASLFDRAVALTRLNGREPKKPRLADSGEGCTDSTYGIGAQRRLEALRVATPEDRARTGRRGRPAPRCARPVTSSQPRPRCEAGVPGRTVSDPVQQHHALVGPRGEVAVRRGLDAEVEAQLLVDVRQAPRERPHVRIDREATARSGGRASGRGPARRRARVRRPAVAGRRGRRARRPAGSRGRRRSPRAGTAPSPRSARPPAPEPRPSPAPSAPCRRVRRARSWREAICGVVVSARTRAGTGSRTPRHGRPRRSVVRLSSGRRARGLAADAGSYPPARWRSWPRTPYAASGEAPRRSQGHHLSAETCRHAVAATACLQVSPGARGNPQAASGTGNPKPASPSGSAAPTGRGTRRAALHASPARRCRASR